MSDEEDVSDFPIQEGIEEMAEALRKWLVQEDMFRTADHPPVPDGDDNQPAHKGWHFYYSCRTPANNNFIVCQPKGHEETIFLTCGTEVSAPHRAQLALFTDLEKLEFLENLLTRIALLDADIVDAPVQEGVLFGVHLQRTLPYHGLTKLAFLQAINEATKVHYLIAWSIQFATERHRLRASR